MISDGDGVTVAREIATPRRPLVANRSIWIFAALAGGVVVGAVLGGSAASVREPVLAIAQPVGGLWLDALTMTVVPLVFALLVTGIGSAAETASAGSVARRALLWFAALLIAACALSALLTTSLLALWPAPVMAGLLTEPAGLGPVAVSTNDWLVGLVPTNPIKAAADTAMVPLVVFALTFGFAVTRIAEPLRQSILTLFQAIVEAMLVIIRWVLVVAPIGVFALAVTVGARLGLGAAGTLLHYVVIVVASCLVAGLLASLLAITIGRTSPIAFFRATVSAQIVAISTQSSLASLPAMVEASPALGVQRDAAGVILPLAVSIFRAASAAANLAVAIYLAHLHGVPLSLTILTIGVLTAAAVSLAAVGLPAQVSFFATIAPVCVAIGAPIALLPVLLAIESVPDIFRTLGNVTADMAVVRLAGARRTDGS